MPGDEETSAEEEDASALPPPTASTNMTAQYRMPGQNTKVCARFLVLPELKNLIMLHFLSGRIQDENEPSLDILPHLS